MPGFVLEPEVKIRAHIFKVTCKVNGTVDPAFFLALVNMRNLRHFSKRRVRLSKSVIGVTTFKF
jgi:hypothetical protein